MCVCVCVLLLSIYDTQGELSGHVDASQQMERQLTKLMQDCRTAEEDALRARQRERESHDRTAHLEESFAQRMRAAEQTWQDKMNQLHGLTESRLSSENMQQLVSVFVFKLAHFFFFGYRQHEIQLLNNPSG